MHYVSEEPQGPKTLGGGRGKAGGEVLDGVKEGWTREGRRERKRKGGSGEGRRHWVGEGKTG